MEQPTKKKKTTTKPENMQEAIRNGYIKHRLEHGKTPVSIYKFATELGFAEEEFYKHYNSFSGIEKDIWHQYFLSVKSTLDAEEMYAEYSVREKLLAFYFTLFELLQKNRSFVMVEFSHLSKSEKLNPAFLKVFRLDFQHFIKELVQEGVETGEVVNRPFVTDNYDKAFWTQIMFLFRFWMHDESTGFEKTDAAIEKSVNLALDLVAKGPVDSMLDFAKFLLQNRSKS